MARAFSELANESVQNFNEHISRNLGTIFCRVFRLEIICNAYFNENNDIIRKLAIHTYWRSSVPATHERTNECHRIMNAYFPWFRFLLRVCLAAIGLEKEVIQPAKLEKSDRVI